MTLFRFFGGFGFTIGIPIRRPILLSKSLPIRAAIGPQGKCDLRIQSGCIVREDQRLDFHMPALQISLRQQSISFFCGFHVKNNYSTRLTNKVIVKDCDRQLRISNKSIQNAIGLCCWQITRSKSINEKETRLSNSFCMFVH